MDGLRGGTDEDANSGMDRSPLSNSSNIRHSSNCSNSTETPSAGVSGFRIDSVVLTLAPADGNGCSLHPDRAKPACERRTPPGWVLNRAAAWLPDWPSSVRIAHSGTCREGCGNCRRERYGRPLKGRCTTAAQVGVGPRLLPVRARMG